jgi:putative FmdB family regulatory protein
MPTYEYVCHKCDEHLEVYQSFSEPPLKRHTGGCGGRLTKVLAPVGIVLKGSGFYKTDSSDSSRSKSKERAESASDTKSESKSGSKTDSKSDSKAAKPAKPSSTSAA